MPPSSAPSPAAMASAAHPAAPRNRVELVGRLAADPMPRVLPSGDRVLTLRVVVARPEGAVGPSVDTLDCAAWTSGARRLVSRWRAGDVVAVEGALRRRFWRTPTGPASRYEVAVEGGRRVVKASAGSPQGRRRA